MVPVAEGIHLLDTGFVRPEFTGCALLVQDGRALLFDCGVAASVDVIESQILQLGLDWSCLDWLVVSHVHLDHAGGAGAVLERAPQARLGVHPRGARHMIDPSKLEASARQVYGDDVFDRLYGRLIPIDPGRVVELGDQARLEWQGRRLVAFDAPGHARHHLFLWDECTRTVMAGDAFGLGYPESKGLSFPTTSPTQFDPEAMIQTFQRIVGLAPSAVARAHYGVVRDAAIASHELEMSVRAFVQGVRDGSPPRAVVERTLAQVCDAYGVSAEPFAMDVEMNTQGLELWASAQ